LFYTVYKTVNNVNDKEYVGFHKINSIEDIICERSENGSIFYDGYLGSGKLMKRALEKYSPMEMHQELILVTDDKEEAEALEKEIVSIEWVKSDLNYNLSIGGNVTILFGEQNSFFGKTHTKETIEKIQRKRKDTLSKIPFSWSKSFLVEDENVMFYNSSEIREFFNIESWFEVNRLVYEGVIRYESEYLQKAAMQRYLKRFNFLNDIEARLAANEKLSKLSSERFKGVPKSKESNRKRSVSVKAWIDENPEKHKERMQKINQNPEKIKKTAEKHKGMKRSDETKKNISKSLIGKPANNKSKIWAHNLETGEKMYIENAIDIPDGWQSGMGKRK